VDRSKITLMRSCTPIARIDSIDAVDLAVRLKTFGQEMSRRFFKSVRTVRMSLTL